MQVGVSHPKWHFYVSGPKKYIFHSCDSLDKKFPVFALDPTRPCLDWQLSWFLTSQLTNNPFKFDLKWRPKCKIWLSTVNCRNIWNVPWNTLMCPLLITNWHWTPIIDPSWGKWDVYLPTVQCQNYSNGPLTGQPNKKKKIIWVTYFYTSVQIFDSKFKIAIALFLQSVIITLSWLNFFLFLRRYLYRG